MEWKLTGRSLFSRRAPLWLLNSELSVGIRWLVRTFTGGSPCCFKDFWSWTQLRRLLPANSRHVTSLVSKLKHSFVKFVRISHYTRQLLCTCDYITRLYIYMYIYIFLLYVYIYKYIYIYIHIHTHTHAHNIYRYDQKNTI